MDESQSKMSALQRLQSSDSAKFMTIAMCCVAMFLDNLSVSGLVYAQQGITQAFGASESEGGWTLSAYSLTFGSFLLLSGSAGDVFGHKIIFVSGFALFSLCCLLIATISSSLVGVIVIRAIQGIAAAGTIPTAYALTATTVSGKARERAVVVLGIAQCIGIVTGTILGGVFVGTSVNYRGLFYLSFGLSFIGTVISYVTIPPSPSQFKDWRSLDYTGAATVTVAALLLVLGFSEAESGWREARVIAPLVLGGCGIAAFGAYETWVQPYLFPGTRPLVPGRVWRYKNLVPVMFVTALFYAAFYSFQLNGAQYLVRVQGHTTVIASVMFLPIAGGSMFVMPLFGSAYNHRFAPPKLVIAAGQAVLLTAILLFTRNTPTSGYWHWTFPAFVLTPLGTASFFVNAYNAAFASAPAEEQGLVSGIMQACAQVYTALGFSVAGSFVTSTSSSAASGASAADIETLREQYVDGFYFSMALAGSASLVALVFVRSIPHRGIKVPDEEEKVPATGRTRSGEGEKNETEKEGGDAISPEQQ